MNKEDSSANEIDCREPDWNREKPCRFWDPGRKLLGAIRDYQSLKKRGTAGRALSKLCVIRHLFWSWVSGADIPLNMQIGGGLLLPHPNGIVVNPTSQIGANCLLFQQVTITGGIIMGGHVDVGAGAKLIGPLVIGDNVIIGANSVVTHDVPSNCTVAGVPARVIKFHACSQN